MEEMLGKYVAVAPTRWKTTASVVISQSWSTLCHLELGEDDDVCTWIVRLNGLELPRGKYDMLHLRWVARQNHADASL